MSRDAMIDQWYPVGLISRLLSDGQETLLMGETVRVSRNGEGKAEVATTDGRALPVTERYGHVWSSLGVPEKPLFDIPEAEQPAVVWSMSVSSAFAARRCAPSRTFSTSPIFPSSTPTFLAPNPIRKWRTTRSKSARTPTRFGQRR